MEIKPSDKLMRNLHLEDMIQYLTLTGWENIESPNPRWQIFTAHEDITGDSLELVFPSEAQAFDIRIYLANGINTISTLNHEEPELTIERMKNYNKDILKIRNLVTDDYDSISLDLAASQVNQLKRLVAYSARSEEYQQPSYSTMRVAIAKRMVEHFRFGHTFDGSFGFTVESEILRPPSVYQRPLPLEGPDTDFEDVVVLPLERRVMERIIRGLGLVKQAVNEDQLSLLVESYQQGLNSQMCSSLVSMSRNKTMPLEYSIIWSPKIEPAADIVELNNIQLHERSFNFIERAASEMRSFEPETVRIRGTITHLTSTDDPFGPRDTPRSVIISWSNRPEGGRPTGVLVSLSQEDYQQAIRAHNDWSTVEVSGVVKKVGATWRLLEAREFEILEMGVQTINSDNSDV